MPDTLVLADARTRAEIVPGLGGGIGRLDAVIGGRTVPILRPWSGGREAGPFALAMNVLVPFSNRISGGGFAFDGAFHALAPNLAGEPCPLHGDGLMRPWTVGGTTATDAVLQLRDGAIGPFRYEAQLEYAIGRGDMTVTLSLVNRADRRLPFGAGFHPWLPRLDATRLQFAADGVWLEDDSHLPTRHVGIGSMPVWDFSRARELPRDWINNAFTGWRGEARVEQPRHGIAVAIGVSANLETAILFSPGMDADFFCFEPVSHPVDAHNLEGRPGLAVLEPGERLAATMTLGWQPLGGAGPAT